MTRTGRALSLSDLGAEAAPWHAGDGAAAVRALEESSLRRMERLGRLLHPHGMALTPTDVAAAPLPLIAALDAWTLATWPAIVDRDDADPRRFRARHWTPGAQAAAYTLVVDVAVALAALLRALRPDAAWAIDHFTAHVADGAATAGRPVLFDPRQPVDTLVPVVYDALGEAFMRYQSIAWRDGVPGTFLAGMRPALWDTHRHLFVGPGSA